MKKLIYFVPLILFLVLIGFLKNGLSRDPRDLPSQFIDKLAPEFSVAYLLDENKVMTQADLKGEVSLLNFWASWCPTCLGEHDILMEISRQSDVVIFGVDYKDERVEGKRWVEERGDPYRAIAFDPEGQVGIDWGLTGTPETFVLDKQGIVRYKHVGAITWQDWKQTLEPIVNELQQK